MKKIFTSFLLFVTGIVAVQAQAPIPELLYYRFNGTGTSVPNFASAPPVGTTTATLMGGLTQGSTGQCNGAVIGSGVASSTDYVNTGYATNLTGTSWTISMYTSNITPSATLFYIFGDATANSFRCFTNGVAGANNWILRGGGLTDVLVTGGATVAPHVTTFVYDMTLGNVKAYLDGVLVNTVAQGVTSITGAGPFKVVGYSSNVGAPNGGLLDEFRMYNRALTAAEVLSLVDLHPTVSLGPDVTQCGSALFDAQNVGATYMWSDGSTAQTLNATSSGAYMVTVTNASGCTDADTIVATINPLPVQALGADVTQCGGTVTLDAQNVGSTYLWSDNSTAQTSTVSSTGTYAVTVTDAIGCVNSDTILVTINSLPVQGLGPDVTQCGSVTLDAQNPGSTYLWSDNSTAQTATVTASGPYAVTVTDANGCSNSDTILVTINPLPVQTLGPDVTQCGSLTLDAQNAGSTYLWSDASTSQTLTVTTSGFYAVAITDANGCLGGDTINVTINPLPTVALGADISQCAGTIALDAQNAGATYLWSDASTNQTLTVTSTGVYSVVVTDGNGCANADTIIATINALPVVNLGNDSTQCGGSVVLDAGAFLNATFLWSDASVGQTLIVTNSGTYMVTVTDVNGCVNSDTVVTTINPPPTVTGTSAASTVCLNDGAVALTGTPAGGTWSGPGVTGSSFSPLTAGVGAQTTTYSYTDVNGCSNSATAIITVNSCVGVTEQTLVNAINVYPNPNNGVFTLSVNATIENLQIVISDLQGRVVYSSNENNINAGYSQQINLQTETAGMYLMQISGNGEQRVEKITVQK